MFWKEVSTEFFCDALSSMTACRMYYERNRIKFGDLAILLVESNGIILYAHMDRDSEEAYFPWNLIHTGE